MKSYIITGFVALVAFLGAVSGASAQGSDIASLLPDSAPLSCINLSKNITVGSRDSGLGSDVSILQGLLRGKGYFSLPSTGYFGPLTRTAVAKFQRAYKLPPTGYVGSLTRAKIKEITCVDTQWYLDVTSPRGGERWKRGTLERVTWQSKLPPSFAAYEYSVTLVGYMPPCDQKAPCPAYKLPTYTLVEATTTDSYLWNVGVSDAKIYIPDGQYVIQVCVVNGANCDSSGPFDIVAAETQTISVTSPAHGDEWIIGATKDITWSETGRLSKSALVTLTLVPYNNCRSAVCPLMLVMPYTIATSSYNDGIFSWLVGKEAAGRMVAPGEYTVMVCAENDSRLCGSSNVFRIEKQETKPVTISVSTDKQIYAAGENISITVSAKNTSTSTQELTFSSGCEASYKVESFDYMKDRMCTMAVGIVSLKPGESKTWIMLHKNSEYLLPVGTYEIEGIVLGYGSAKTEITIRAN